MHAQLLFDLRYHAVMEMHIPNVCYVLHAVAASGCRLLFSTACRATSQSHRPTGRLFRFRFSRICIWHCVLRGVRKSKSGPPRRSTEGLPGTSTSTRSCQPPATSHQPTPGDTQGNMSRQLAVVVGVWGVRRHLRSPATQTKRNFAGLRLLYVQESHPREPKPPLSGIQRRKLDLKYHLAQFRTRRRSRD
jgi:hypothetical protein